VSAGSGRRKRLGWEVGLGGIVVEAARVVIGLRKREATAPSVISRMQASIDDAYAPII